MTLGERKRSREPQIKGMDEESYGNSCALDIAVKKGSLSHVCVCVCIGNHLTFIKYGV